MPLLERLTAEARKDDCGSDGGRGYFSADVQTHLEPEGATGWSCGCAWLQSSHQRERRGPERKPGQALDEPEGRRRIATVKGAWSLAPGQPFRQSAWRMRRATHLAPSPRRYARGEHHSGKRSASRSRGAQRRAASQARQRGRCFTAGALVVSGFRRSRLRSWRTRTVRTGETLRRAHARSLSAAAPRKRDTSPPSTCPSIPIRASPAAPLRVSVIEAHRSVRYRLAFTTDTGFGVTVDTATPTSSARVAAPAAPEPEPRRAAVGVTLETPPRRGGLWDTYTARMQRRDVRGDLSREGGGRLCPQLGNWRAPPSQMGVSAHIEKQTIEGLYERKATTPFSSPTAGRSALPTTSSSRAAAYSAPPKSAQACRVCRARSSRVFAAR